MVWVTIGICYVVAAVAFYTVAAKTATPQVELMVVDGANEANSKAA